MADDDTEIDPITGNKVPKGMSMQPTDAQPSGTPSEPTDPEAGKADMPDDPNRPSDVPKVEELETEEQRQQRYLDNDKAAVDTQIGVWRKSQASAETAFHRYQVMQQEFHRDMAQPDAPPPQPYQLPQQGQPPTEHSKAATFLQFALPAALMVGLAIAGGKGKRGMLFLDNFLGSAFTAYSQGRNQESKRRQDEWWKHVQEQKAEIKARNDQFRETLADKRFNLAQKMAILKTYGQVYGDEQKMHIADRQDLKAAQDKLKQDEKAYAEFSRKALAAKLKAGMLTRDSAHKDYYDALRNMYYNRTGTRLPSDPNTMTDDQTREVDDLMKELPFEKFREQRKTEGRKDASGKENPYPGEEEPKTDREKHLDQVFGPGKQ